MANAQALLDEYSESHQNSTNKLIHWVAVPLIYWSGFAMLWSVSVPVGFPAWLNWAIISLGAVQLYYFSLSLKLGLAMLPFNIAVWGITLALAGVSTLPMWQPGLAVFVLAWVFQFVGHKIEGKKPSFFTDVLFLLVGPAWCVNYLLNKLGWRL